jgi:N6-adenosine-specific RNA methylase IME4
MSKKFVSGMVPIAKIKIGHRHRRDLGDIPALARNIFEEVGALLHPVVITPTGDLVSGARRIAAFVHYGRDTIPVTVIDLEKVVLGEYSENVFCKAFTPSEAVAITRAVRPIEEAAARERQAAAGPATGRGKKSGGGKFPQAVKGKTRDKVGAIVGISGRTLEKAEAVVAAAEAEPEKYGKLLEIMDRTARVSGVHRRLKVLQQAEAIRKEPPPLPGSGPYRVIVSDVPARFEKRKDDPSHRGTTPYPNLSIEEICALKVSEIAHEDCVLFHWTTNAHLLSGEAVAAVKTWGFTPKTILTWAKDRMGAGDTLRGQTEHCIVAVRGRPTIELTNQTTLLVAPARDHSRKPAEFYSSVESLCPAPRYTSLFHRGPTRPNWDGHGDETPRAKEAA